MGISREEGSQVAQVKFLVALSIAGIFAAGLYEWWVTR